MTKTHQSELDKKIDENKFIGGIIAAGNRMNDPEGYSVFEDAVHDALEDGVNQYKNAFGDHNITAAVEMVIKPNFIADQARRTKKQENDLKKLVKQFIAGKIDNLPAINILNAGIINLESFAEFVKNRNTIDATERKRILFEIAEACDCQGMTVEATKLRAYAKEHHKTNGEPVAWE